MKPNYLTLPAKEIEGLMNKAYSDGYNSFGEKYSDLLYDYSQKSDMLYEEFMRGSDDKTKEQYKNMPSFEKDYLMF